METGPVPHPRTPILIWLLISQLLALASLILWLLAEGYSAMAFDPGVPQEAWKVVIVIWAYPVWPLAFTLAAWIAYAQKRDKLSIVFTTLTFLPVLLLIVFTLLSSLSPPVGL